MDTSWSLTQAVLAFALSSVVGVSNILVFKIVMAFGLVYTVYATTVDPKKGKLGKPGQTSGSTGSNPSSAVDLLDSSTSSTSLATPTKSSPPPIIKPTWFNKRTTRVVNETRQIIDTRRGGSALVFVIQELLRKDCEVRLLYVPLEFNSVADKLASFMCGQPVGEVVFAELPDVARDVVTMEALLGQNLREDPGG
ncbi:hypothetical protein V6N13_032321 [Hibiscus sabdariffa]